MLSKSATLACFLATLVVGVAFANGTKGGMRWSTDNDLDASSANATSPNKTGTVAPATCAVGESFFDTDAPAGQNTYGCTATNTWTLQGDGTGGGGVPAGTVVLVTSGTCAAGFSEVTALNGKTLVGTVAANADVGTTGGTDNITPTGTNSALTFTGSALGTHLHAVGTYDAAAVSAGTPAGSVAWPVGVPTFAGAALSAHSHGVGTYAISAHSGTAVTNHASHTHTYTQVVNHVHVQTVNSATTGGTSGYTPDTSTNTAASSGYSTANPTGGVATGTTNSESATLTHSVTQPSDHSFSGSSSADSAGTPSGSISWPAGVPTFSGSALGTHDHTLSGSSEAVSAGTPAGTINTPTFTGNSFDNRSAFVKVIFCSKD